MIALLFSIIAHADSFELGVERLNRIRARTDTLLRRAGVLAESGSSSLEREEKTPSILNLHALPTGTFLPQGSLIFGLTHMRLLVGEMPSPIQVVVEIAQAQSIVGLKVLGTATQSQGRIFMEFDRLILRSGKAVSISATALDTSGSLGLKGENENSKSLEIGAGVALGILAPNEERQDALGLAGSLKKPLSQRLKDSILGESRDYLKEQFREKPILRLDENTQLTILLKEELRF